MGGKRKTCIVTQRRLDSLFEQYGVPELVKIDVEGYEEDVIISAGDMLLDQNINVIIAELNDEMLITQLIDIGFHMYEYNPFKRLLSVKEKMNGRNGIFIRNIERARQECVHLNRSLLII